MYCESAVTNEALDTLTPEILKKEKIIFLIKERKKLFT
jgi:hypothetical protein